VTPVAIALGSNIGDRDATLRAALDALAPFIHGLRASSFHTTEPVDMPGSPAPFLNAAAVGETDLPASGILDRLLDIEQHFGRTRPHPGASRTLDLDLILYGSDVISEQPRLLVPHPRFRERAFVLAPLAEVAGEWTDPLTGLTVSTLLERLDDGHGRPFADVP
jgi:2-amino-4-hydroxy-6-hydroxymethyldihydropteridine diphosphokinase